MRYEPTRESVRHHPVPEWYHDAKLGIFVHWGLYSVPGWAPLSGEYKKLIAQEGWANWFSKNPYAEWYLNTIRIEGSPSQRYHLETYGQGFSYDGFAPLFNAAIGGWDASEWASLFRKAGARYVVLTTKHHDGFLLWPSEYPNPKKKDYIASRDIVGELAEAVRGQGMKMGLYYSGGLDWSFDQRAIRDAVDLLDTMPQGMDYVQLVSHHWRELIERYEPSVVWNDIGYPAAANVNELFADYYNRLPEGVVNDRFMQVDLSRSAVGRILRSRPVRVIVSRLLQWAYARMEALPVSGHCDFRTPEYAAFSKITQYKWEATRGLGYSFGYNRNEGPDNLISLEDLIHSFVDTVSKNGNLLLNVGPMADGTIPEAQRERLEGLGQWLDVNGEAIFGTRPWLWAEGSTDGGIPVRFTQKVDAIYAILLGRPRRQEVSIDLPCVAEETIVHLLGHDSPLRWAQNGKRLTVSLPQDLPPSAAYALRIGRSPSD